MERTPADNTSGRDKAAELGNPMVPLNTNDSLSIHAIDRFYNQRHGWPCTDLAFRRVGDSRADPDDLLV